MRQRMKNEDAVAPLLHLLVTPRPLAKNHDSTDGHLIGAIVAAGLLIDLHLIPVALKYRFQVDHRDDGNGGEKYRDTRGEHRMLA